MSSSVWFADTTPPGAQKVQRALRNVKRTWKSSAGCPRQKTAAQPDLDVVVRQLTLHKCCASVDLAWVIYLSGGPLPGSGSRMPDGGIPPPDPGIATPVSLPGRGGAGLPQPVLVRIIRNVWFADTAPAATQPRGTPEKASLFFSHARSRAARSLHERVQLTRVVGLTHHLRTDHRERAQQSRILRARDDEHWRRRCLQKGDDIERRPVAEFTIEHAGIPDAGLGRKQQRPHLGHARGGRDVGDLGQVAHEHAAHEWIVLDNQDARCGHVSPIGPPGE